MIKTGGVLTGGPVGIVSCIKHRSVVLGVPSSQKAETFLLTTSTTAANSALVSSSRAAFKSLFAVFKLSAVSLSVISVAFNVTNVMIVISVHLQKVL